METSICPKCGVKSVSYQAKLAGETVTEHRDYMPITLIIRLKPDTTRTYIVEPELHRMAVHCRSLDDGKLNYAVDIPLPDNGRYVELLNSDQRIEDWDMAVPAFPGDRAYDPHGYAPPVCESHVNFTLSPFPAERR